MQHTHGISGLAAIQDLEKSLLILPGMFSLLEKKQNASCSVLIGFGRVWGRFFLENILL